MSQHDFDIANQTASSTRSDINGALKALASLSSGVSSPATTYANMLWYDTGTSTLRMRDESNSAWIPVAYLNQSTDKFAVLDDTQVVNSGGTQTGLLGDQATATWQTGTATTESLVSPAKIKSAIDSLVVFPDVDTIGKDQSWSLVSRTSGTSYQNTAGRAIQVCAGLVGYTSGSAESTSLQVSSNGSTWVTLGTTPNGENNRLSVSAIIPNNHYYRYIGSNSNASGVVTSFATLS